MKPQFLREFLLEKIAEYRRCGELRLWWAESALGESIAGSLQALGGMAGEW